jgi:hypothetical protein
VPGINSAKFTFHRRSHQTDYTKEEIFSTEEITNYASHLAIALVADLYGDDAVLVPNRPKIPAIIRDKIKFKE